MNCETCEFYKSETEKCIFLGIHVDAGEEACNEYSDGRYEDE